MRTIGAIILLICMALPPVIFIGHEFYWLIRCLREGGDWKFYAVECGVVLWAIAIVVGFALWTSGLR